ncbi:MAG: Plasmid maintenance system killer protein [uncultured bacterium]|nr:MAG: Plasmid maintenance system killer protein [uncultured bacterium]
MSLDGLPNIMYYINMIKSFKHKGLKKFFEQGSIAGINPEHEQRLRRMLAYLDRAKYPEDMNLPGYKLHPLKGDKKDLWSVIVNGNWRLTYKFENGDAFILDYQDYH